VHRAIAWRWTNKGARTLCGLALVAMCAVGTALATPGPTEQKLIDQLIHDVRGMGNTVFVRNGMEYTAQEAADHLHEKFIYFRDEIKSADDFIRLCATKSEITGLAYHVRDAAGVMHESAAYLSAHLAQLRGAPKSAPVAAPPVAERAPGAVSH
jgi:hypothetical protein